MSYCVNCGVKLDDAAKKCPLCDTPVINPNIFSENRPLPAFPERIELPKNARTHFTAVILSLLLLLPNVVCVLTNLFLTPHKLWSLFVVASSLIFWFLFIFPFLMKKRLKYFILLMDAAATAVYIFIFYYYQTPFGGWFWRLAVPIDIAVFTAIGLLIAYFEKKRNKIRSILAVLVALIAFNLFLCLIVNLYVKTVIVTYITMIFAVSCLILLLFFAAAEKNYKLRAWLSRKLFF